MRSSRLNLMDAALPLQTLHGFAHLATRKLFDHLFQLRVFLANDLFELHCLHAASWSCAKGRPASTASCCRRSPTSNTRSFG